MMFMDGGWRVIVRDRIGSLATDVLIYRPASSGGDAEMLHFREDGMGVITQLREDGGYEHPTFRFDGFASETILPQMISAFLAAGIKPVEQSRIEGMFEAQTRHMEDLRHMLRLPKPEKKDGGR